MRKNSYKIALVDCTKSIYNEEISSGIALGGIERCIISLSRALSNKGHDVQVFAHEQSESHHNNIRWVSKLHPTPFKADIVIACNDPKLFDLYATNSNHSGFQAFLWHHNPVGFWKTLRKGRLLPLLKWNPTHILLGTDHLLTYPKCLSFQKKMIIEHGVEDSILDFSRSLSDSSPRPPHAAFISQAYRGLENVIDLWKKYVFPEFPSAKLFIYSTYPAKDNSLESFGITIQGRLPREKLLNELSTKRITLIPGHEDETFCLSAIESQCLGLPVISFGIGALKERIQNQDDGFLVSNEKDFAEKILFLLKNDDVWLRMSQKAKEHNLTAAWSYKATLWESLFEDNNNDQE